MTPGGSVAPMRLGPNLYRTMEESPMKKLSVMLIVGAFTFLSFALPAQAQRLKSTGPGGLPAVCTSTDGKATCDCGDEGCLAQKTQCICAAFTFPTGGTAVPDRKMIQQLKSTGPGGLPAVCTSTDEKQTCDCGKAGCLAGATGCACLKTWAAKPAGGR